MTKTEVERAGTVQPEKKVWGDLNKGIHIWQQGMKKAVRPFSAALNNILSNKKTLRYKH